MPRASNQGKRTSKLGLLNIRANWSVPDSCSSHMLSHLVSTAALIETTISRRLLPCCVTRHLHLRVVSFDEELLKDTSFSIRDSFGTAHRCPKMSIASSSSGSSSSIASTSESLLLPLLPLSSSESPCCTGMAS